MMAEQNTRETLSAEEVLTLLDRLLLWLLRSVKSMEKPLVTKKLCAALAAYFLRPHVSWNHCVRHLICCFKAGGVVPSQAVLQHTMTAELVMNLDQFQLMTALWFSTILIEEVGKTDASSLET